VVVGSRESSSRSGSGRGANLIRLGATTSLVWEEIEEADEVGETG